MFVATVCHRAGGLSISDDLLETVGCLLALRAGSIGSRVTAVENETCSLKYTAERDWARDVNNATENWWRVEAVSTRAGVVERWLTEREDDSCKEHPEAVEEVAARETGLFPQDQVAVAVTESVLTPEEAMDEVATLEAFFARKDKKNNKHNKTKKRMSSHSGRS